MDHHVGLLQDVDDQIGLAQDVDVGDQVGGRPARREPLAGRLP
ncbi:hypothetical protein AB0L53_26645 [Nonomuraea sp. NPDC052129]